MFSLGNLKYLRNDRSVTKTYGPVKSPTPSVPGFVGDGALKAAGLKNCPGEVGASDTPGTLSARRPPTFVLFTNTRVTIPPPSAEVCRMGLGGPDGHRVMPLRRQPPHTPR